MSYIGRQNLGGAYRQLDDISSGFDGSDTTHTMQVNSTNVSVGDVNQILLSLGGVIQKPGTDFTVSGSTLTFTTAPAANTSFFAILLGSDNGGTVTPTDGSVTTAKIVDANVTTAKITDANVTKAKLADSIDIFAGTSLSAADLGAGIHIKSADSGASVQSTADELVIEGSGSSGMSILSANDSAGYIFFGDDGASNAGGINYDHSSNQMKFVVNSSTKARFNSSGTLSLNDSSPDADAGGLTLNQGANDTNILTFKSSDVAHGMTGSCQTDTYALFSKQSATKGGLQIRAFCEDLAEERLQINVQGDGNVTESTNSSTKGAIAFTSSGKSGTAQAAQNANGNIMSLHNFTTTRFLFEGNGEFHADASSNTFDEYEDAQLVRAFDLSHGKGVIDSKFDKFVAYNHEKLAELKLVGREDDGTPNHFVNVTGFQRLHNGAIWQQYEKHQKLANAMYELAKAAVGEDKANEILEKHDIKLLN